MTSTAARRAERCFALARSTTFAGEREAAITRGLRIVDAAGLSPDDFDIPGRTTARKTSRPPTFEEAYADPRYHRDDSFDWSAYQDELERHITSFSDRAKVARSRAPDSYTSAEISELTAGLKAHGKGAGGALEDLYATLARREAEVAARPGETVYEARRRNFDEAIARSVSDAAERGEQDGYANLAADVAVDFVVDGSAVAQAFLRGHFRNLSGRMAARQAELRASKARRPDEAALVSFLFARGIPVYDLGADADARWYVQQPNGARELDDQHLRALADEIEGAH